MMFNMDLLRAYLDDVPSILKPADVRQPEVDRQVYVRGSRLPACETELFLAHLYHHQGKPVPPGRVNIWSDLYMAIGRAVHEVYQDYLGRQGGLLWGFWRCPVCGYRTPLPYSPRPTKPHCQEDRWQYVEPEVIAGPFVGHVDGLLSLDGRQFALLEIKTYGDQPVLYESYRQQAVGYCWALSTKFKTPVRDVVFMFAQRQKPWPPILHHMSVTDEDRRQFHRRLKETWNRAKRLARQFVRSGQLDELPRRLCYDRQGNVADDYKYRHKSCPFAKLCDSQQTMLQLVEHVMNKQT